MAAKSKLKQEISFDGAITFRAWSDNTATIKVSLKAGLLRGLIYSSLLLVLLIVTLAYQSSHNGSNLILVSSQPPQNESTQTQVSNNRPVLVPVVVIVSMATMIGYSVLFTLFQTFKPSFTFDKNQRLLKVIKRSGQTSEIPFDDVEMVIFETSKSNTNQFRLRLRNGNVLIIANITGWGWQLNRGGEFKSYLWWLFNYSSQNVIPFDHITYERKGILEWEAIHTITPEQKGRP